jgi:predicted ATPase/DNA-binding CsgD family transcriptional regulator
LVTLTELHLPASTTPFVGRETNLAEITRLLSDPGCRLVSLVGPGGIGKTRLAQEAAHRMLSLFDNGVCFVSLQALSAPDFIVPAIAEALEYELNHCCDLEKQLVDFLQPLDLLLVMDNFEHLLAGVGIISTLLTGAPGVKVLATSRETLNVHGEWVLPLSGLMYPTSPKDQPDVATYCALALFEQSARRVRADFSLEEELAGVVRICALVEGMPLALEFAAAWVNTLSCDEIAAEIQRSLDFLKSRMHGGEQRHTSMRAVLDYSWNLLSPGEQQIFMNLAVFRGSFTRQAAAAVARASLADLSLLIDKSLVRRTDDAGRYDIHELVRQYAERQLNAEMDNSVAARTRHVEHYMGLLQQIHADLFGAHPQKAMRTIEREIKNIRVAWGWAAVMGLFAEIEKGLESLWFFYDTRGWYREGEKMLDLAVDALRDDSAQRELYGKLITRQGVLASSLNWFTQAEALLDEGLAIARQVEEPAEIAFSLVRRGTLAAFQSVFEESLVYMNDALSIHETIDEPWDKAYALNWLGLMKGSRDYVEQSDTIFRQLNSEWGVAVTSISRGYFALNDDDVDTARALGEHSLTACQEIGIRWGVASSYEVLGWVDLANHAYPDALRHFREMFRIAVDSQLGRYLAIVAVGIGRAFSVLGEDALALEFLAAAYRYYELQGRWYAYLDVESQIPAALFESIVARSARIADPVAAIMELEDQLDAFIEDLEPAIPNTARADLLTDREIEVLGLVGKGMTNRAIADELILSVGTIKWYLSQIYSKIGVGSRTQALARARELGLLT